MVSLTEVGTFMGQESLISRSSLLLAFSSPALTRMRPGRPGMA